jgi:cysteine desulfurase
VNPESNGCVSADAITQAMRSNTVLVSVMYVNNETGAINEIAEIGAACRERGVLFHTDAAQGVGKLALDVKNLAVDLLSISAHKMYGPKGIGALYVRRSPEVEIREQMHGGGHERGMRSGTLATHQIAGLGAAAEIAKQRQETDFAHLKKLRKRFLEQLNGLEQISINGDPQRAFPGIVNLAFDDVDGETLLMSLRELAISSGSACLSASLDPSHVLKAMGCLDQRALNSLRFSFGRYTSEADIDRAVQSITSTLSVLS